MACNVCDELTRAVNREPPGSDLRKEYEYKLIWHLAFQGTKFNCNIVIDAINGRPID